MQFQISHKCLATRKNKSIHQSTFYTLLFNHQNMTENVCKYALVIQRGYTSMQQRNTKFNKRAPDTRVYFSTQMYSSALLLQLCM